MGTVIVVLPKIEDSKRIQQLLSRNECGHVIACALGAQALTEAGRYGSGLMICGYKMADMFYYNLLERLPEGFRILVFAGAGNISKLEPGIMSLELPVSAGDILDTVNMILYQIGRIQAGRIDKKPAPRSEDDKVIIQKAKILLMERNNLSENDAYRYIQKTSMDNSVSMKETAEMILMLNG